VNPSRRVRRIQVLEDRAGRTGPADGFLRLRRLTLVNEYEDGTRSAPYPCDVVSRRRVDAVTILLFRRKAGDRVEVALREGYRAPIWLRCEDPGVPFPEDPPIAALVETVAGVIEEEDARLPRSKALRRRARLEAREEVGIEIPEEAIFELGAASFPSPGVSDEKVYFCAAEAELDGALPPSGDGSVMEEAGGLFRCDLEEAIRRCREGAIPDMKTEIALTRLRDRLSEASQ